VARECVTLTCTWVHLTGVISVLYAHRAIPVGWLVIEGEKGHFPTETYLTLLREVKTLVPQTANSIARNCRSK